MGICNMAIIAGFHLWCFLRATNKNGQKWYFKHRQIFPSVNLIAISTNYVLGEWLKILYMWRTFQGAAFFQLLIGTILHRPNKPIWPKYSLTMAFNSSGTSNGTIMGNAELLKGDIAVSNITSNTVSLSQNTIQGHPLSLGVPGKKHRHDDEEQGKLFVGGLRYIFY